METKWQALQQIHQCIEQFDLDGVDRIMEKLEEYQIPECIRESMDQLRWFPDRCIRFVQRVEQSHGIPS